MITLRIKRIRGVADREMCRIVATKVGRVEVTNMCRMIKNQATIDCPVDTGNLRAQHITRVNDMATSINGEVINNAKYAADVHDGTTKHTIKARKKKALRFEMNGKIIIVRSVKHPGTKARPWLREAAERMALSNGWRFTKKAK